MVDHPWFKFYPTDWRADQMLRLITWNADQHKMQKPPQDQQDRWGFSFVLTNAGRD
jgi:hypothetical protein